MINITCAGLIAALKIAGAGAVLGLPGGNCAVPMLTETVAGNTKLRGF